MWKEMTKHKETKERMIFKISAFDTVQNREKMSSGLKQCIIRMETLTANLEGRTVNTKTTHWTPMRSAAKISLDDSIVSFFKMVTAASEVRFKDLHLHGRRFKDLHLHGRSDVRQVIP